MFLPIFNSENSVQPGEDWFDWTLSRPCTLFSQKFSSRFILLKTGSFNSLRDFIHRHETSICAHIFRTNSGFLMATSPYKNLGGSFLFQLFGEKIWPRSYAANPFYLSTSLFLRKDVTFSLFFQHQLYCFLLSQRGVPRYIEYDALLNYM